MGARTLTRIDAGFEGALGAVLVVGVATGGLGADDFPHPVGSAAVVVVGCLLLLLAIVLWRGGMPVRALAVGNAVTAGLALIWFVATAGFSTTGAAVLAITIAALAALAAAQARSDR